jgi:hypothetical protein
MSEFTPKPWVVEHAGGGLYEIRAMQGPIDVRVATVCGLSDANLIGAAPDMLDIVREVALLGAGKCIISKKLADMALDALVKAEGRTKD